MLYLVFIFLVTACLEYTVGDIKMILYKYGLQLRAIHGIKNLTWPLITEPET